MNGQERALALEREEARKQARALEQLRIEQARCRQAVRIAPIGEDRCGRRYWIFPALGGALVIEDTASTGAFTKKAGRATRHDRGKGRTGGRPPCYGRSGLTATQHGRAGIADAAAAPVPVWRMVPPARSLGLLLAWLDQRGLRERGLHHELTQAADTLQANADAHELWLQARLAVVDADANSDADDDRAEVSRVRLPPSRASALAAH